MALTHLRSLSLIVILTAAALSAVGQRHGINKQQIKLKLWNPGDRDSFSPTCHLGEGGDLLCDRCQPGYTGPRCDR